MDFKVVGKIDKIETIAVGLVSGNAYVCARFMVKRGGGNERVSPRFNWRRAKQ
jgi:hypothetical protein